MNGKNLIIYFRVIANAVRRELDREAEKLGLTAAQGIFLHRIWRVTVQNGETIYARDLEEFFHVKHPTVSGILSRMEEAGYLRLEADTADRRCKTIRLTQEALELHSRMEQLVSKMNGRLTEGMSAEEAELFETLLRKSADNMGIALPSGGNPSGREEKES